MGGHSHLIRVRVRLALLTNPHNRRDWSDQILSYYTSCRLLTLHAGDTRTHIKYAGGALVNRDATDTCAYCRISNISGFLELFHISHADRWFYFGVLWVFIVFNVVGTFAMYWIFRVPKGQRLGTVSRE
jgi:hypothetical protein